MASLNSKVLCIFSIFIFLVIILNQNAEAHMPTYVSTVGNSTKIFNMTINTPEIENVVMVVGLGWRISDTDDVSPTIELDDNSNCNDINLSTFSSIPGSKSKIDRAETELFSLAIDQLPANKYHICVNMNRQISGHASGIGVVFENIDKNDSFGTVQITNGEGGVNATTVDNLEEGNSLFGIISVQGGTPIRDKKLTISEGELYSILTPLKSRASAALVSVEESSYKLEWSNVGNKRNSAISAVEINHNHVNHFININESIGISDSVNVSIHYIRNLVDSIGISDSVNIVLSSETLTEPEPTPIVKPTGGKTGGGRTGVDVSAYDAGGPTRLAKIAQWVSSEQYFQIGVRDLIAQDLVDLKPEQVPKQPPEWFYFVGKVWSQQKISDEEYYRAVEFIIIET